MSRQLNMPHEQQAQGNWCWAAIAVATDRYYSAATIWTQCQVAADEFGQQCCSQPSSSACNRVHQLEKALNRVKHYRTWTSAALTELEVREEIDRNRPVAARLLWQGGGSHFVTICGYDDSDVELLLTVEDPLYGQGPVAYNTLLVAYRNGQGRWTHSYYTQ